MPTTVHAGRATCRQDAIAARRNNRCDFRETRWRWVELVRIFSSGLEHPPPDRFIRYVETPPGQPIFHVSEAQREPAIEPNGVLDDFRREAVAPIRDPFHRRRLNGPQHLWEAINVTMPIVGISGKRGIAER